MGVMTLRRALEQSRNIPAVKVIDMLGPGQVAAYAARFGFREPFRPFLSMALGAQEATLIELTSAYSVFPEPRHPDGALLRGVDHRSRGGAARGGPADAARCDPGRHRLRHDQPASRRRPARHGRVGQRARVAAGRQDRHGRRLHRRVVHRVRSEHHGRRVAGTRREEADRRQGETGTTAALPMWMDFMRSYIELRGNREQMPAFDPPGNIVFMAVDRNTGEPLPDGQDDAITEAFLSGTQPVREMQ